MGYEVHRIMAIGHPPNLIKPFSRAQPLAMTK